MESKSQLNVKATSFSTAKLLVPYLGTHFYSMAVPESTAPMRQLILLPANPVFMCHWLLCMIIVRPSLMPFQSRLDRGVGEQVGDRFTCERLALEDGKRVRPWKSLPLWVRRMAYYYVSDQNQEPD